MIGNPDYVLDCIDDPTTKAELLAYCIHNNIKVFSSLGAGAKSDPTALLIGDLSQVACKAALMSFSCVALCHLVALPCLR